MTSTTLCPKIGMTLAQTVNGNTRYVGVVTRITADRLWVRPETWAGVANYRRSLVIHRMFWDSLSEIA